MKEGVIKNIFFATDSDVLLREANKYVEDKGALVTVHNVERESFKEFLEDGHDSFKMRNSKGMHTAVLEWFILGEADYCMSPTDELSTFSKVFLYTFSRLFVPLFYSLPYPYIFLWVWSCQSFCSCVY